MRVEAPRKGPKYSFAVVIVVVEPVIEEGIAMVLSLVVDDGLRGREET